MEKHRRNVLGLLLALAMCLGLAVPVLAAGTTSPFEMEGTVLMSYNGPGGDVIIPNGVTCIGNGAFFHRENVTSVTIPDSVTEISWGAFDGCSALTGIHVAAGNAKFASVDGVLFDKVMTKLIQYPAGKQGAYAIPDSVTCIGDSAFYGCTGLTAVTIPANVTSIESSAFCGCSGLTSVAIPQGVRTIESSVFGGCRNLKSVTIPAGVTSIGEAAFSQCFALASFTIPASVTSLGMRAFAGCTALASVTIPTGITSIPGAAFSGCEALTGITIPAGVTSIGERAFSGCTGLTSVTIPEGVTTIEEYAFHDCTALAEVSVPKSMAEIGPAAFQNTPWLAKLGDFAVANGILFQYQGAGGAVTIPDGVTSIGEKAFASCTGVTSLTIPEGVTSIGHNAFQDCTGLTGIILPDTITRVGMNAFSNTPLLEAFTGPMVLGNVLVYYKSQEQQITVPDGVATIGPNAFDGCPEAVRITIPGGVTSIDEETVLDIFGKRQGVFGACEKLTGVVIKNGDARIGQNAFTWIQPGMMMGTGTLIMRDVTIYAPSGGKVEGYSIDNALKFVSTGGMKAPAFSDVSPDDYFSNAVRWAAWHGITNGTGATVFSPGTECKQVEILTFLWRAMGEPKSSGQLPTQAGPAYAEGALRWAMEQKMIDSAFQPMAPCTRAAAVKFIWQAVGSPNFHEAGFSDVPAGADYAKAVDWAAGMSITTGTTETTFSPGNTCTRGQIVTFLFRARTSLMDE